MNAATQDAAELVPLERARLTEPGAAKLADVRLLARVPERVGLDVVAVGGGVAADAAKVPRHPADGRVALVHEQPRSPEDDGFLYGQRMERMRKKAAKKTI